MAKVLVVTSGKGGVGKTTSTAALGAALAQSGENVVVVDFDVGLRNLDLIMGAERRVVYDLINVIRGEATLRQAAIKDKRLENLYILPASQTRDKDALTRPGVEAVIDGLKKAGFEYIICDSPAGIEHGALMAMYYADHAFVVTNAEVSSVRDSDRILGLLDAKTHRAEMGMEPVKTHLLLTRYSPARVAKGAFGLAQIASELTQVNQPFAMLARELRRSCAYLSHHSRIDPCHVGGELAQRGGNLTELIEIDERQRGVPGRAHVRAVAADDFFTNRSNRRRGVGRQQLQRRPIPAGTWLQFL